MAMDFMKLGAVGTVDKVLDTDTVLVERGGSIYRVAGNRFGGAGGFLLEVDADTAEKDGTALVVSQDVTDMVAAYQAGSHVVLAVPLGLFDPELQDAGYYYMSVLSLLDAEVMEGDPSAAEMYVATTFSEGIEIIYFTNGNPFPASEASVTALRMKKGASDGES